MTYPALAVALLATLALLTAVAVVVRAFDARRRARRRRVAAAVEAVLDIEKLAATISQGNFPSSWVQGESLLDLDGEPLSPDDEDREAARRVAAHLRAALSTDDDSALTAIATATGVLVEPSVLRDPAYARWRAGASGRLRERSRQGFDGRGRS